MSNSNSQSPLDRRTMLAGIGGAAALVILGGGALAAPAARRLSKPELKLVMHRSSGCGCCLKWVDKAREAGFTVEVVNSPDILAFKQKHGVPKSLMSCHTTLAGPYVVEGHVPPDAIKKLLLRRPKLKGIAVPGMPIGSPGMEVPGMEPQPFKVQAFDSAGKVSDFA